MTADVKTTDVKTLRRELAAAFRLAARFELNEGVCNHFSVVVPGAEERFLINPYGIHWAEMRPDDLLLIDGDGTIHEGWGEVEASARNIHIAGHRANPRHQAILHVHMPHATALTMVEGGRLEMAHQTACRFLGRTAYQGFGGVALTAEEGERIAQAQKDNPEADIIFLDHHGVTVGGPTVAVAFDDLYYLERACRQQILALSTGLPLKLIPEAQQKQTAREWMQVLDYQASKHFEALMRLHGL
ncbi:aldolase [Phreatobacter sp. AB_2022a]|uniref:aldolase n=1 Tax=Phreatobacter sp. AB_2022a TaxID=3003134 RepID=UPI0022870572|nr:aldolase [Phreatobacter sp. AB_2022a]MCZ0736001.1 aldolase [Phreatobacter sp. AB_2022a]